MINDKLGDRMKDYEMRARSYLIPKLPVIIRLDGKAFHTFTKGLKKPADEVMVYAMKETTKYLCKNIQNCVLGYTQSDEITLVLIDKFDNGDNNTDCVYDNQIEKICSVSASMATLAFNKAFAEKAREVIALHPEDISYNNLLERKINTGALFDSRCFNLPKHEVLNCLIWRQLDANKNAITMQALEMFSHKELQSMNGKQKIEMMREKGFEWEKLPSQYRWGIVVTKQSYLKTGINGEEIKRSSWECLEETPVFKDTQEYWNDFLFILKEDK